MKYLTIFIFIILTKNLFSLEVECSFEEVYQNGESQQGFFLIKDEKFRYQYDDKSLFTIIHNQNIFFLIENIDPTRFFRIDENIEVLKAVVKILGDYPDFRDEYYLEGLSIKIEQSNINIIKRLILLSDEKNLSIYVNDCKFHPIKNLYFSYSPYFNYK